MATTDMSCVIKELRQTFSGGRTRPVEWRLRQLRSAMRMVEENEEEMMAALAKDLRDGRKTPKLGNYQDFFELHIFAFGRQQSCQPKA
jgi:acyl-CoA reductase-like NAD-dependent aldehyde dehydrogenase